MESPCEDLDPRQRVLLRAVIVEYVGAAEPVASEHLVQKYDLGVKSATIRNELAHISELGYLEQPHTSSGRIPSDLGYRYFVDHMVVRKDPEADEAQTVKSATEEGEVLDSLLRDTTKVLSRLTHLLSAAAVVRDRALTVRSAILSAIGPSQALLVLALGNGHVESRMIECPAGLTLDDVGKANALLSRELNAKTLTAASRSRAPASKSSPVLDKLLSAVWSQVRSVARELTKGALVTEGEEFLFGQPEFKRDADFLAQILDTLQSEEILYDALASPPESTGSVTIGRENRSEHLHRLTVIRKRFFVGQNEAGSIAVIGPTRMAYEQSIPLVDFTAKALSDCLTRAFG